MQTGTWYRAISNAATWTEQYYLLDDADGAALWDYEDEETWPTAVTLKLRDPATGSEVLSGSLGTEIQVADDGVIEWQFASSVMSGICPKTYEMGLLLTLGGEDHQFFLGNIQILKGL